MIFVTNFTAVQTFNFYITFILLYGNCTQSGIRNLLSFISGNVLQRKPTMGTKCLGLLTLRAQSQPRSQDLCGVATKMAISYPESSGFLVSV